MNRASVRRLGCRLPGRPLIATAAAGALLLAGCGSSTSDSGAEADEATDSAEEQAQSAGEQPAESEELFPIKLRADIYYHGAFMPFLAGIDQGIFAEHGIDLQLGPGKGSGTTIQTVANGSDDIGYADAGAVVQSIGKGMPVQVVAGMVQETPLSIAALPDSGITEPSDLPGHTGSFTPGSASELLYPGYAEAAGFDPESTPFKKVDFALRDQMLLEGQVDFTFGFTSGNLLTVAEACDCELNILRYSDVGMVALSSSIVVSNDFAENNAEQLRKFLAATAEAVEFTKANPDVAVEGFFRVAEDTQLSPELVRQQWDVSVELLHSEATADEPFGCMAEGDWESTIDLQERYADVPPGEVTLEEAYTNEYLPESCSS